MSHYINSDVEAARVRAMLEAKRHMDAGMEAYQKLRAGYMRAQQALTGSFPSNAPPGPYICGDYYIVASSMYATDEEVRFIYTRAIRIKTSE